MKFRALSAAFGGLLFLFACQNADLPAEDDAADEASEAISDDDEALAEEALTVAELIAAYEDTDLDGTEAELVKGYVVGACKSTISNAFFSAETIAAAEVVSNILLSDNKNETDADNCAPVELEYGSDMREDVNLTDNPDNLGRRILVMGYVEKYFGVVGLKDIQYYQWIDDEEEDVYEEETADADDSEDIAEEDDGSSDEETEETDEEEDVYEEETADADDSEDITEEDDGSSDEETEDADEKTDADEATTGDDDAEETDTEHITDIVEEEEEETELVTDTLAADTSHVVITGGRVNKK